MKGVILAGGFGIRLRPLTDVVNKQLLPVYDRPMIFYPLATLRRSGIADILVVTEQNSSAAFKKLLGTGQRWGVRISYRSQRGAGGIAVALHLTQSFAAGQPLMVVLGDNIFEQNFQASAHAFRGGAMVFLKKIAGGWQRFGVPVLERGRITCIEEKPEQPRSKYAVTGAYLVDHSVFGRIRKLKPSVRGELEITDVLNDYLQEGLLRHTFINGYWSDVGTFESLLAANVWVARHGGVSLD